MSSQHTTEPWELDEHLYASDGAIWGPDGMRICRVEDRGGTTKANALLIAAAPDLLAACERAHAYFERAHVGRESANTLQEALRAAIAKARGK